MKPPLLIITIIVLGLNHALAQDIVMNSSRERDFVFEVKQIDEFFERFNNEKNTLLSQYINKKFPGTLIDRESLISSLFNKGNKNWQPENIRKFSRQVTDSLHPFYLDFSSADWLASAICRFKYKGNSIDVNLVLKIQKDLQGGMKWVILSASSPALPGERLSSKTYPALTHPEKFLNPMSHATDFMDLAETFEYQNHTRDYLDSSFYSRPRSQAVLRAVLRKELVYQYVRKISYYFFQVDGWIFTVNHFERKSSNSGWLINSLLEASPEDKTRYMAKIFEKN